MSVVSGKFGPVLAVIMAFSLPPAILMVAANITGDALTNFILGLLVLFVFSVTAGLVSKETIVSYLVPVVAMLVFATSSLFPYVYVDWSNWFGTPFFGLIIGMFVGFCASQTQKRVLQVLTLRKLSLGKRDIFIIFLSCLILASFYGIYVNLDGITAYLDQHSWFITIIGIVVSSLIAFLGRGYYERRKSKK